MGTERCDYVMIAAKFDCKEFENVLLGEDTPQPRISYEQITDRYDDNPYDFDTKTCNGLTMVRDGMSGKYAFFGEVIAKTLSDGFEPLNISEFAPEMKRIKKKIKKAAKKLKIKLPSFKIGIYVFSHWH